MIDHTGIDTGYLARSVTFYDAVFAALGGGMLFEGPKEHTGGATVRGYGRDEPAFWVAEVKGDRKPTSPNHFAFSARSRAEVNAFYKAAIAAGGRDNGPPGLRVHYHPTYYGAFVLDPDGNNIEAVCHLPE
jgi:catechol 2,3-dioxygenase-like lactoylglutathione lyase family enzyme